jgi:hypothetical protein
MKPVVSEQPESRSQEKSRTDCDADRDDAGCGAVHPERHEVGFGRKNVEAQRPAGGGTRASNSVAHRQDQRDPYLLRHVVC